MLLELSATSFEHSRQSSVTWNFVISGTWQIFQKYRKEEMESTLNVVTSFLMTIIFKLQSGLSRIFNRDCAVVQQKSTIAYFRIQNFWILFLTLLLSCPGNYCDPFQFVTSVRVAFDSFLSSFCYLQVTTVCRNTRRAGAAASGRFP